MRFNKYIILGIISILFGGILFLTNGIDPIIRPITYLFLMGSSKGKDILFFGLFGLFLIFSQLYKVININTEKRNRYLNIAIILAFIVLILGIGLEVLLRLNLGIPLGTIFVSMKGQMSSTSIIHSHIYKSILGTIISSILGNAVPVGVNTGSSLYYYTPKIANIFVILIPFIFVFEILSNQKRSYLITIIMSFFSSCLIIGIFDGGFFSTPGALGLFGLFMISRNSYYLEKYFKLIFNINSMENEIKDKPSFSTMNISHMKFLFLRTLPYILALIFIFLRVSISILGTSPDYYEVDIVNPIENIEITNYTNIDIKRTDNEIVYKFSPEYKELELLNGIKEPLKDKCDYYTITWNLYSYLYIK